MARRTGGLRHVLAVLALAVVSACSALYENHGWAPGDDDLAAIKVGVDTRETVGKTIGAPSSEGLLAGSAWYYVESRWKSYAYRAPVEVDRQVVAISFSQAGTVSNIERFGLERGQVVVLSQRVTDSNIRGVTFLRQLFGSIGRFSASQLVDQ
jgi:outer membrane protein assembly factor BamE (lipoprotein component of BamABCDE complex)